MSTAITKNVAISSIVVDKAFNSRNGVDKEAIKELAASLNQIGLQSAIVLREDGGKLYLIQGFRRLSAAKELGWKEIEAKIHSGMDEKTAYLSNLAENVARKDLRPIEVADRAYLLKEKFALSADKIAESVGLSKSHVYNLIRIIAKVVPEILDKVRKGQGDRFDDLVKLTKLPPEEQVAEWEKLSAQATGRPERDMSRGEGGEGEESEGSESDSSEGAEGEEAEKPAKMKRRAAVEELLADMDVALRRAGGKEAEWNTEKKAIRAVVRWTLGLTEKYPLVMPKPEETAEEETEA